MLAPANDMPKPAKSTQKTARGHVSSRARQFEQPRVSEDALGRLPPRRAMVGPPPFSLTGNAVGDGRFLTLI